MSTLYNPYELMEPYDSEEPEFHPLFSDAEIEAYERRRDAERVEFECKAKHHNALLEKADRRMRRLKPIEI
jgi:hypothetical protein